MRTVILFPGSFNPVHYGHVAIAEYLASQPGIDEVRMLISPRNPLKSTAEASLPDRLSGVKKALSELPAAISEKITASDFESTLPKPRYTWRTLEALSRMEPDTRFILAIGGDNILIIEKWSRWEAVLSEYEIWIYPRPGYPDAERRIGELTSALPSSRLRFLSDAPQNDISSTRLRSK